MAASKNEATTIREFDRAGHGVPMFSAQPTLLPELADWLARVLRNHPTGHHGFEGRDANAATRQIIDQTLEFVRNATLPDFQGALRSRPGTPPA